MLQIHLHKANRGKFESSLHNGIRLTWVEHLTEDPMLLDPIPIAAVHFNLQEDDNLSMEDKTAGPKCTFIRRFHCLYSQLQDSISSVLCQLNLTIQWRIPKNTLRGIITIHKDFLKKKQKAIIAIASVIDTVFIIIHSSHMVLLYLCCFKEKINWFWQLGDLTSLTCYYETNNDASCRCAVCILIECTVGFEYNPSECQFISRG